MAQTEKLTDAKIRALKPKDKLYKVADGRGLYVWVHPNSSKYFRIKYRYKGKENSYSVGVYPDVSLKEARQQTFKVKTMLNDGLDPNSAKSAAKHSRHYSSLNDVAYEWLRLGQSRWTRGTFRRNKTSLEHVLNKVGKKPVEDITQQDLRAVLDDIQDSGRVDLAHRIVSMLKTVFDHAIYLRLIESNPALYISKFLKRHKVKHISAAISQNDLKLVINSVFNSKASPTVKHALMFQALTFIRTKELRFMEWPEINWDLKRIEIPAEKMKMAEPFIIPLSEQACSILEHQKLISGNTQYSKYVFAGQKGPQSVLSENTLNKALRAAGVSNTMHTSHGYRSVARTMLDEDFQYRIDWIEMQLSHKVRDSNGRAYNRTRHLDGRSEMMQHWSDYVFSLIE
jgi:integrase